MLCTCRTGVPKSKLNTVVTFIFLNNCFIIPQVTVSDLTDIVLHQNVVSISAVSIVNSENQVVPLKSFNTDDHFEILIIKLENVIPAGIYTITVTYLGQINENPIDRGFYKGYYYIGENRQ